MLNLQERLFQAGIYLQRTLQMYAPIDKGNLMMHGILPAEMINPYVYEVIIGGGVVNYAVQTNEVGRNQGWVEKAIDFAMPTVRTIVFGNIDEQELQLLLAIKADKVQEKLNARAIELL